MSQWVRTFEFAARPEEVWAAFTESTPGMTWNGMVPAAVVDPAANTLTWSDRDEDIDVEMSMRIELTETATGARVTLTRSGFGDGDMFEVRQTSKLVAWTEAFHDLAVYLETGRDLKRLFEQRSATGVQFAEVPGGLRVTAIREDSFGSSSGLEVGDLVVGLAGVPVFDRSDLWLLQRAIEPGTETSVRFLRGGELRESSAAMSSSERWATGELGGAPSE